MPKQHNQTLGEIGENRAKQYLLDKGYTLLAQNWRHGRTEIDLIMRTPVGIIVFVEVKNRSSQTYGTPELAVSAAKQKRMATAALAYLMEYFPDASAQFDVIAIQNQSLHHFEDAFQLYAP